MPIRSFVPVLSLAVLVSLAPAPGAAAAPGAASDRPSRYAVPPTEKIRVAFVLTEGAVMIDFAGPWEVFQDVHVHSRGTTMDAMMPFELYTVSESKQPIHISDGMQVIPDYTFDDAPAPRIVVIPAQSGNLPKMFDWLRTMSGKSDVVMSVCTGAFQLGRAGLLKGKHATTHHGSYDAFARNFPDTVLERDMRFVQSDPTIFTAGGLSSGIDLALHVVELYFGRDVAASTARYMEYEGKGWMGNGKAAESFVTPGM